MTISDPQYGQGVQLDAQGDLVDTFSTDTSQRGPEMIIVGIDGSVALSKTEIQRGLFEEFVKSTRYVTDAENSEGCNYWEYSWQRRGNKTWRSPGYRQTDSHPVVCVSKNDAAQFAQWLSEQTGQEYFLPSEALWEAAATSSIDRSTYWDPGDRRAPCTYANISDLDRADEHGLIKSRKNIFQCKDDYVFTAPVGHYDPNPLGFHDMLGNVGEWAGDCWNGSPVESTAKAGEGGDCNYGAVRGASWFELPEHVNTNIRLKLRADQGFSHIGFRVARRVNPDAN